MLAVAGGGMPVRPGRGGIGMSLGAIDCSDCAEAFGFRRVDPAVEPRVDPPYFSSNSCVELYLVAVFSFSIVASRSF